MEIPEVFCITDGLEIASRVFFSISKPSCAENLIARTGLRPSSVNLSMAFPTVLMILFFMSVQPSKGSFIQPVARFAAIAFIVKSRLDKSSSIFLLYSTLSGCRPSE